MGHVGSPRGRPLTEEESHRLIQVDVVEEESDDDLGNSGNVDEYSMSDVAGEVTDEDFDLIVDATGDLVEFMPEEGEGETVGGEDGDGERQETAVQLAAGEGATDVASALNGTGAPTATPADENVYIMGGPV